MLSAARRIIRAVFFITQYIVSEVVYLCGYMVIVLTLQGIMRIID